MNYICSLITVENIEKSKFFYETILGQKIKYDFGENIQFESGFAIHLKSHFKSIPGFESFQIQPGSKSIELYFEDENILNAETELEKYCVEFIHKTLEQPWRQQVMRVLDPDGYIVEIGESMPDLVKRLHEEGMDTSKIHKVTSLPEKFIQNILTEG
jgi:catechol 2,3-dioxygenase-like lactoylglutathione lyase family enzyme